MNIQNNLDRVLDKFPKDKTELASQKIELTSLDELRKLIDSVDKLDNETNSWMKPVKQKTNEINNAKEDIRDLLAYSQARINELQTFIPKLEDIKDKISQQAKDLGVKPKDIKGYDKIAMNIAYIKGRKSTFASAIREATKISKQ